jgi:small GTP-binding protein
MLKFAKNMGPGQAVSKGAPPNSATGSPSRQHLMFQRSAKVVVVGAPGVGKSRLVTALTAPSSPRRHGSYVATTGVEYGFRLQTVTVPAAFASGSASTHQTVKLHLWDVAGHVRHRSTTCAYFSSVHVLVMVYDASRPVASTHALLTDWLARSEVRACAPRLVYLVGVSEAVHPKPTRRLDMRWDTDDDNRHDRVMPQDCTVANVSAQAMRVFADSAKFVVSLETNVFSDASVHALAQRIANDVARADTGNSFGDMSLSPASPKITTMRVEPWRQSTHGTQGTLGTLRKKPCTRFCCTIM